jgi:hypothetical protein
MPAAPKPVWIVFAYFMAQFLVGGLMKIDNSYYTPAFFSSGMAGLPGSSSRTYCFFGHLGFTRVGLRR